MAILDAITDNFESSGLDVGSPLAAALAAWPIFGGSQPADDGERDVLAIPDVTALPLTEAALRYARAGLYLLPTDPSDIKNPGSMLGNRWQDQSSCDPEQVQAWWAKYPDAGIVCDAGRSGLIAFDLDEDCNSKPTDMCDDVWVAFADRRSSCNAPIGAAEKMHVRTMCSRAVQMNSATVLAGSADGVKFGAITPLLRSRQPHIPTRRRKTVTITGAELAKCRRYPMCYASC